MTSLTHLLAWKMLLHVTELLESIPYEHENHIEWRQECVDVWNACSVACSRQELKLGTTILYELLTEIEQRYLKQLHQSTQEQSEQQLQKSHQLEQHKEHKEQQCRDPRQASIQRLLSLPQVPQRTEDWYEESRSILSASQYETIFKPPRTRGHLVMEKAGLTIKPRNFKNVVRTEDISAFTWGIRFEPVVKMLYEDMTQTTVADLGRLRHSRNPKLGASPDGLVTEDRTEQKECLGRFVEFKAPVSRVINRDKIPEGYWMQMQIQMEVGDVEECDYLEVTFASAYKTPYVSPESTCNPPYYGIIALIRTPVPKTYTSWETGETLTEEGEDLRYAYSPLNADASWEPTLNDKETVLERIPWHVETFSKTTVKRDREWYETKGNPTEALFWADVEAAKAGTWTLPESSRKTTVKKNTFEFVDDE